MDLPTCPACGQSVLDDDATECPFCGAAMDGSSSSKKPSASGSKASPSKPVKKKQEPDDGDPFAIDQAPVSSKVIPCARKPMKGRMQRILCPMCETQGFIPKGAIGRQVKCANKECLVPVFTASTDSSKKVNPRAPARVSNATVATETKVSSGGSRKNPMLVYGIVGAIALAATIGLVSFLNSQGVDKLGALPPLPAPVGGDDTEEEVVTSTPDPEDEVPEYRAEALETVEEMISQSRVSGGNRDKAFCRRLTGDSFLRLGMPAEAEVEFTQMDKVSSDAGRQTEYYRIPPLVSDYWRKLDDGNTAGATAALAAAKALITAIPTQGETAWESTIVLASALLNSGDAVTATQIVAKQDIDESVGSQLDSLRLAAWDESSSVLGHSKRKPLSPLVVFSWRKPLHSAIAFDLAIRSQWLPAIEWANSLPEKFAAAEACGIIAAEMAQQGQFGNAAALLEVAKAKGPEVLLRTNSALGRTSATHWDAAAAGLAAMPTGKTIQQTNLQSYIDATTPDIEQSLLNGEAITDYVIAASMQGNTEAAAAGLDRLFVEMTSAVAPTAELRRASAEVANNESSVRQKIADELRLRDTEVRSRFIQYRRGIDRLVKASEERHRSLMYMLARIVDGAGIEPLKTILAAEGPLKNEIQVDAQAGLLYCAAAANGVNFPESVAGNRDAMVPLFRADPAPELRIMRPMLNAWQGFLNANFNAAIGMQSVPELQGLAAATVRYIAGQSAETVEEPNDLVESVLGLSNGLWRERCLTTITRSYCRQGKISKAIGAVNKLVKSPSQKVSAFFGILQGALEMDAAAE